MPSSWSWLFDDQRRATSVHLFSNELATYDNIRDEVDLGIELPVVCDLANEFLRSVPLPKPQAYEVVETLALDRTGENIENVGDCSEAGVRDWERGEPEL